MGNPSISKTAQGMRGEAQAVAWLQRHGLVLLQRNFRTPGRGGGEIDAIMRAPDGTLVFVEVRTRADAGHGGAAASISKTKQRRIILAARHYLQRWRSVPPCRFDVMACDGDALQPDADWQWLPAAFDASA